MFGLADVRAAMTRVAARFGAALLPPAEAVRAVDAAAAIEHMAATVKSLAAARVAASGVWRAAGDRSAAYALARATGTSVSLAAEAIETGRRLDGAPAVAAAARRGELSAQQTAAITTAAAADPGTAARLVDAAGRVSLGELRDECARTRAAAEGDPEARRRRIHAERYLRTLTDGEGAWCLRMRDNPEVGAGVMAALEPVRDRLFRAARAEGRREPAEAYAADALVELARARTAARAAGGTRPKVIVRVDLDALLRGRPVGGEVPRSPVSARWLCRRCAT